MIVIVGHRLYAVSFAVKLIVNAVRCGLINAFARHFGAKLVVFVKLVFFCGGNGCVANTLQCSICYNAPITIICEFIDIA